MNEAEAQRPPALESTWEHGSPAFLGKPHGYPDDVAHLHARDYSPFPPEDGAESHRAEAAPSLEHAEREGNDRSPGGEAGSQP
jgi:hypothetical protein